MVVDTEILPIYEWLFGAPGASNGDAAVASALGAFLTTAAVLVVLGLLLGYLVTVFRYGPVRSLAIMGRFLKQAPIDLVMISPRRVLGLAGLAMREAFRRRIWIALVLFVIVLMFAGWVLNPDSDDPATLYLNFVLTATTYLMLPIVVFTSAFSLPNDIQHRTIYTITTKPVRASEIVLGRMLGFTAVATLLLFVMGVGSYLFVVRGLDHTHALTADEMTVQKGDGRIESYEGKTARDRAHRHTVSVHEYQFLPELEVEKRPDRTGLFVTRIGTSASGASLQVGDQIVAIDGRSTGPMSRSQAIRLLKGPAGSTVDVEVRRGGTTTRVNVQLTVAETMTAPNKGHKHHVTVKLSAGKGSGDDALSYTVGPPEGMFLARVPKYGRLRFRTSSGDPKDPKTWEYEDRGISVGKMFAYRSYIRGNTLAAAIWTFEGLRSDDYPNGLPLDINIRMYRSHTGKVDAPLSGSLVVRNPKTGRRSRERIFKGKEFAVDRIEIPRKLIDQDGNRVDLFEAFVVDGAVDIQIRCVDSGQYFGVAQADVYIRSKDASFSLNFAKGFVSIWLQVTLVIALAVAFSTFLSGPVAMLLTLLAMILGIYKAHIARVVLMVLTPDRMKEVASHERVYGGGPVEAFVRLMTQDNLVSSWEEGWFTSFVKGTDYVLMTCIDKLLHLLPDFQQFDEVTYLSHGYDIQGDLLLQHAITTAAFLLAAYVIGYVFLKTREMAR